MLHTPTKKQKKLPWFLWKGNQRKDPSQPQTTLFEPEILSSSEEEEEKKKEEKEEKRLEDLLTAIEPDFLRSTPTPP